MTPHDMSAATLVGDIKPGEVKRVGDDVFIELQDLSLSDTGSYFTTAGGSRIPLNVFDLGGLGKLLDGGGIVVVPLPGAFIKAT